MSVGELKPPQFGLRFYVDGVLYAYRQWGFIPAVGSKVEFNDEIFTITQQIIEDTPGEYHIVRLDMEG